MRNEISDNGGLHSRIDDLCDQFEARLRSGEQPRIEDILPAAAPEDRPRLLQELANLELEYRRPLTGPPDWSDYARRFPELWRPEFAASRLSSRFGGATTVRRTEAEPPIALPRLSPGERLGKYILEGQLGSGAFGEVWRAHDPQLQRTVAIKTPRTDLAFTREELHRYLLEGRRVAQLNHPGIVTLHDFGEDPGNARPYLVYELIDGASLREILQRGRLERRAALELFCQVCDSVEYAHRHGIIHRDLKPGNILVDRQGATHVVDFGMAKMPSADMSILEAGMVAGTPQYMAPEQAAGDSQRVTFATDVYALGVVLYEMLTGTRPFQSTSSDLLRRIREETPQPMRHIDPSIPAVLDDITLQALHKNPEKRHASPAEFASAIRLYLTSTSLADAPTRLETRAPSSTSLSSRRGAWLVGAGVLAIAAAAASFSLTSAVVQNSQVPQVNVEITTRPAGARMVFWGLDPVTNAPDPAKRFEAPTPSPVQISLPRGRWLVVADLGDGRFHEVVREIPASDEQRPDNVSNRSWERRGDVWRWPTVVIPDATVREGMVFVPGAEDFLQGFEFPDPENLRDTRPLFAESPPIHNRLADFYIDPHEASWEDVRRLDPRMRRLAVIPDPAPLEDPALLVWTQAAEFAELAGKRLPTEAENEFVATNRGATLFPWGDDPAPALAWTYGPVGQEERDVTRDPEGVYGLFSNAGEWTSTRVYVPRIVHPSFGMPTLPPDVSAGMYFVRGLPLTTESSASMLVPEALAAAIQQTPPESVSRLGARFRSAAHESVLHGLRCVRSAKPRLEVADLAQTWIDPQLQPNDDRDQGE